MKKKWLITALVIVVITLVFLIVYSEISKKTEIHYIYKGESAHWVGKMIVDGSVTITKENGKNNYKNPYQIFLNIHYTGDPSDFDSSELVKYSYNLGSIAGSEMCDFNKDISSKHKRQQGLMRIDPDETATITITVGNNTETMQLKNSL